MFARLQLSPDRLLMLTPLNTPAFAYTVLTLALGPCIKKLAFKIPLKVAAVATLRIEVLVR